MKVGSKVKCAASRTATWLTEGKVYEVVEHVPTLYVESARFTFSSYTTVINDNGKREAFYSWRFEEVEDGE